MLKHPKWQQMRLEVMERADFKCEKYGCDYPQDETNPLNVHHKYYDEENRWLEPWEYPRGSLQCLCRRHHEEVHNIRKEEINKTPSIPIKYNESSPKIEDTILLENLEGVEVTKNEFDVIVEIKMVIFTYSGWARKKYLNGKIRAHDTRMVIVFEYFKTNGRIWKEGKFSHNMRMDGSFKGWDYPHGIWQIYDSKEMWSMRLLLNRLLTYDTRW